MMIFTAIFIYLYDLLIFKLTKRKFFFLMETLSTWHKILFQTSRMPKNSMKIVLSAKKKLIRNKNAG
ncbi:hypothetical protein BTQ08_02335 [Escherichia coli]|nr:hypothetical protein AML74_11680 [Escherichia coli]PAU34955.1 hypothetical protein BTQ08_02335 [Escherichia coli]